MTVNRRLAHHQPGRVVAGMSRPPAGRRKTHSSSSLTAIGTAPKLILAAMFFVTVFRLHELAPTISSVIRPGLLTGPIGFALLLATHTYDTRALTADPIVRWVSAFVCWAILTVPFALFRGLAFEQVQVLLPGLLLVLSLSVIPATHRALDLVSEIFVSGGGLLGIAALLWGESSGGRLAVTSTLDPNDLGALMAMTLPFAMHRIASEKGLGRLWGFAVALVTLIVVAKTGSRGSTIALAFGAVIFAIASSARQRMVWIISLAVCGLAGWILAPSTFRERMSTLNSVESDYNATEYTGRTKIWARGITYAVENPVLGVGIGNFPVAEGNHLSLNGYSGKWSAAHNAYVQAVAELGFIGFSIFVGMIVAALRSSWRWTSFGREYSQPHAHFRPDVFSSLIAFVFAAFFLSMAYSWVLFGLLGIAGLYERVRLADTRRTSTIRYATSQHFGN